MNERRTQLEKDLTDLLRRRGEIFVEQDRIRNRLNVLEGEISQVQRYIDLILEMKG